jgi:Spy/CpxP family protein refolding chaperone
MKTLIIALILVILSLSGAGVAVAQGVPQASPCVPHARVTPTQQKLYDRTMRRFESLGLSPQQQQQIQALIAQFSQTHPAGSPLDPEAMRQLRQSILAVLTPQQRDTLTQENEQRRSEMGGSEHQPCR